MGGFAAARNGKPIGRLSPYQLEPFLKSGRIKITEAEIQDRSKGDALAKALIILQTNWFIIQSAGRVYSKLPVSELELVTLAYAIFNTTTYTFWWNKPLNVKCCVLVEAGDLLEAPTGSSRPGLSLLGFFGNSSTTVAPEIPLATRHASYFQQNHPCRKFSATRHGRPV
jgi:hypothetical protein